MDSIQYIMDIKKAHDEIGYIGLGIMGKPMVKNLIKVYTGQKNNLVSLEENIKTMDLIKRIYF